MLYFHDRVKPSELSGSPPQIAALECTFERQWGEGVVERRLGCAVRSLIDFVARVAFKSVAGESGRLCGIRHTQARTNPAAGHPLAVAGCSAAPQWPEWPNASRSRCVGGSACLNASRGIDGTELRAIIVLCAPGVLLLFGSPQGQKRPTGIGQRHEAPATQCNRYVERLTGGRKIEAKPLLDCPLSSFVKVRRESAQVGQRRREADLVPSNSRRAAC